MKWEGGEVRVTLADGQKFVLPAESRAAQIIAFVMAVADDVNDEAVFATLTFDLAGDVKPALARRWPAIKGKRKGEM